MAMQNGSNKKPRPKRLSPSFAKTVKEPGVYGDGRGGHGFQMVVTRKANGELNKYFRQRVTVHGKQKTISIGAYPLVTLAEAREKAIENARIARAGLDPQVVNSLRDKDAPTFAEAAEMVITERAREWREGSSTQRSWRGILKRHAFPKIGHMRVDAITEDDIVPMMTAIWSDKQPTAKLLFGYVRDIMGWCRREGYRDDNPVNENVREYAPRRGHKAEHHRFVEYQEVGGAVQTIRGCGAAPTTKLALLFQIFTACRHVEARKACWDEIDWDRALWTVPGEHMKMGNPHRIPLSSGAIAVLERALQMNTGDSDLIFPSRNGGGIIYESTLGSMCKTLGLGGVPHGFRATFATWCADVGVPQELAEAALAHTPNTIVQAYTHTDYLERRRPLIQMWSDHIEGKLPDGWSYTQATCVCGGAANRPQAA